MNFSVPTFLSLEFRSNSEKVGISQWVVNGAPTQWQIKPYRYFDTLSCRAGLTVLSPFARLTETCSSFTC